jgi:hypothetical protein
MIIKLYKPAQNTSLHRRPDITKLASLLVQYRTMSTRTKASARKKARLQSEFLMLYTKCCRQECRNLLEAREWHSDRARDAEDLAQNHMLTLAKQEIAGKGVFALTGLPQTELECYLARTLKNGAAQALRDAWRKTTCRILTTSLEAEGPEGAFEMQFSVRGVDIPMKIDCEFVLEKLQEKAVRDQKKYAGTTPLSWLLAGSIENLPKPMIAERTLERKVQQIRKEIKQMIDGPSL